MKEIKVKKQKMTRTDFFQSIVFVAIVGIISYFFFSYIIMWGEVPTGSMEPTIMTGDYVITNGLAYVIHEPQRGDIIAFDSHEAEYQGMTLTKRVVGLPGDDLMFIDGYLYINGELVYEEYLPVDTETNSFKDFEVPEGCYFVMGDNRENSIDSRFWNDPFVRKNEIKGKIILII